MVGITIITGFLGSGKTTLLKNLLRECFRRKKQIAIIHNEFTDENRNIDTIVFKDINDVYKFPKPYEQKKDDREPINKVNEENEKENINENINDRTEVIEEKEQVEKEIELAIVKEIENENGYIYELNNGCLCCSNKSNFVALIEQILSMKCSYDAIFVEVAGVYDNIKVNNLLWLDELNESKIYLDSIVHVVDSFNFLHMSDHHYDQIKYKEDIIDRNENNEGKVETELIYKQILVCDVLLINKIDKIEEKDKEHLQKFMKNLNPLASIFLTQFAKIDMEKITNLKCYEKKNIKSLLNSFDEHCCQYNTFNNCFVKFDLEIKNLIKLSEEINYMKEEFLREKNKDTLKAIFDIKKFQIFSYRKINEMLASLLWNSELKIYRGKGFFVAFNDDIYNNRHKLKLNIYYYQSVGDVYEINFILTDIHLFFKEFLQKQFRYYKENRNNEILTACGTEGCFQDCQVNKSEMNNKIIDINTCKHSSNGEINSSSNLYQNFLENEYLSYSSSDSSDMDDYNLNNVLDSSEWFASKFLFIGKEINEDQIREKLNSCLCENL